jgi:Cu(I)/Ag(I) efflux system membrane protein CusA/SilA
VAAQLTLPPGYTLAWSGQCEFMQRVRQTLTIVLPVTVAITFLLLYLNSRDVAESVIVMWSC